MITGLKHLSDEGRMKQLEVFMLENEGSGRGVCY